MADRAPHVQAGAAALSAGGHLLSALSNLRQNVRSDSEDDAEGERTRAIVPFFLAPFSFILVWRSSWTANQ